MLPNRAHAKVRFRKVDLALASCPAAAGSLSQIRCGIALVETVGVMAIVATILSLSAVILHQSFQSHQQSLAQFRDTEQLQRICERLRRDVNAAQRIDTDDAPSKLALLASDGSQISYYQLGGDLTREATVGGAKSRTEHWQLPEDFRFQWSLNQDGMRPLVVTHVIQEDARVPEIEWLACALEVVRDE